MTTVLRSETETAAFAQRLGASIKPGFSVGLCGPLGSGKTTLVRLLCTAWAIGVPVSSPSYVLEHRYPRPDGVEIEHWDLYRIKSLPAELLEAAGPAVIRLVEWADKFPEYLSTLDGTVLFSLPESNQPATYRSVELQGAFASTGTS